jgi:ABC-type multidrug transport system ATPase subunit
VLVKNNLLVDNRGGVFMDGTPFTPKSYARFENNTFAFNDIAVTIMPAVKGAEFSNNTFWENIEQMAVNGGGAKADANAWRENFWSDYSGLDGNGDGLGDTPYVAERFFENMTDREPLLRAVLYSPAAQAIEFAAASFPIVKPQPKFSDPAPRLTPPVLPAQALSQRDSRTEMIAASAFLLALAAGAIGIARGVKPMFKNPSATDAVQAAEHGASPEGSAAQPAVRARGVGKSYGRARVLEGVSFEVQGGSALALWGPNGAGKTTLVKAMLGLIPFDGEIQVAELGVKQNGKKTRGLIGYVPQEVMFYDWSVKATLDFYARVKRVSGERIQTLLEQLGLTAHASKPVAALSGGLKQRLALALALLADPPILLLDEPTANLDTQARSDYVRLVAALKRQGKTIVFASHRLEEVEALADEVLWLANDKAARAMTLEEWRANVVPAVELTLWFRNGDRERANEFLNANGWNAHLNGRGTVVVRTRAQEKLRALRVLQESGFVVDDFEVERQTEVE